MTQPLSADVQRLSTQSGQGTIRSSLSQNVPVRRPIQPFRSNSTVVELSSPAGEPEAHPAKRRRLDDKDGSEVDTEAPKRTVHTRTDSSLESVFASTRPPTSFAAQLAGVGQGTSSSSNARLPPLPVRPWKHKSLQNDAASTTTSLHHVRDYGKVQSIPFRLEAPTQAPKYCDDRVADFAPWTGKHPEDTMNEHTARNGHLDRAISQNENGTARPSLYSIFKHKSGLDTLSSLFLRVVEQREAHGKIGAASSFKPPPRVTLTEAKRKAWLNDLADADVPLRKLSRTIPQGIRGQQLLDQCLVNSVPVGRAVWFAKCVGANEIRTLKRKGTSGTFVAGAELKWLQDWTTGVEHFLNDIILSCGGERWRTNMTYAMHIVSRFYSENMLDKDHFVDWLVSSLGKAGLDMLPIWLTISRGFWEDITRLRRHGRVFVRALLKHLKEAQDQDTSDFTQLIAALSQNVRLLAVRRPLLLVLPDLWADCRPLLETCLGDSTEAHTVVAELAIRNTQLRVSKNSSSLDSRPARQALIGFLDFAKAPFDIANISQSCLEKCQDHYALVRTLLEWSSTPFRIGNARKYLVFGLLRHWCQKGIDIDQPVRDIVTEYGQSTAIDLDTFLCVTSLLLRSRTISLSRYLQTAIATGVGKSASGLLRLIQQAPTVNAPAHVKNLRKSVLERAGYPGHDEEAQVAACKNSLAQQLPSLLSSPDQSQPNESMKPEISELSRCVQAGISNWISSHVGRHYKDAPKTTKYEPGVAAICLITPDEFYFVRAILEQMEDLPILADCLRHASRSEDDLVLAAVAETLNAHFEEFSAIGALSPLCSSLGEAYYKLRSSAPVSRTFTISLLDLTKKFPNIHLNPIHLLEDLARGDRNTAIAACSPISDHMAENLQQAGASFIDEYDQLLSGGNIMDDQTMARLFWTLAERIESSLESSQTEKISLCQMVVRLMAFRPKQFDQLLQTWLKRMVQSPKSSVSNIIESLIGSGVTSTSDVLMACKELFLNQSSTQMHRETERARQNLSSILNHSSDREGAAKDSNLYRLQYSREQCLTDASMDVLRVLTSIRSEESLRAGAMNDMGSTWEVRSIVNCLVNGPKELHPSILANGGAETAAQLLGLSFQEIQTPSTTVLTILDASDAFSLPLRQALMKHVYDQLAISQSPTTLSQADVIHHLFDAARRQPRDEKEWQGFVSAFGSNAAQSMRQRAEEAFFGIPPPIGNARSGQDSSVILSSELLIDMIGKTAFSIPETGLQSTASSIVDRLAGILRCISSMTQTQAATEDLEYPLIWTEELYIYFSQLLRLATLHQSSFTPSFPPSTSSNQWQHQLQIRILLFLTSITLHPSLAAATTGASLNTSGQLPLVDQAIDVLAILSDNLHEDSRAILTRHLKDRMRDARARTLFGSLLTESSKNDEELVISREANIAAGKEAMSMEYKVKNWELIQGIHSGGAGAGGASGSNDTSMSLSLFQGRVITGKSY